MNNVVDDDDNYVGDGDDNDVVDANDNYAGADLSGGRASDEVEQQPSWRTPTTKWIRAPPPGMHAVFVPNRERAPREPGAPRRAQPRFRHAQAVRTMAKAAAGSAAASGPAVASGFGGGCMCSLEKDNTFSMVLVALALIGFITVCICCSSSAVCAHVAGVRPFNSHCRRLW